MNQDFRFEDHSVEVKMSLKKLEKIYKFSREELEDIHKQFNHFADKSGEMDFERFKKFVGLLGFGEAETICQRLFSVIISKKQQKFDLIDFLKFLSSMIFGNTKEKAMLSFKFIDRNGRNRIGEQEISKILCQISILWNYLTGQKVLPTRQATESLYQRLGILDGQELNFEEYLQMFEEDIFDWYAFFNGEVIPLDSNKEKKGMSLDKMESLLDLFSHEIYDMILSLKENSEQMLSFSNEDVDFADVSPIKGPLHIESRFAPLRGDIEEHSTEPLEFEKMFEELKFKQENDINSTFLDKISNKLKTLADLGKKAQQEPKPEPIRESLSDRISNAFNMDKMRQRKVTIMNKGKAAKTSKSGTIYLGHQNWNLIVNMMLGIRKSVNVLYMPKEMQCKLTPKHIQQQYQGKFAYQLISKKDEKFQKSYCYTFVDYAPKVFYRIRADEGLTKQAYLRSIGPQNLIGSLVTGKLATLNQQISEGKSGNFFYYTEDSRFIAKAISQQQCHQVKNSLKNYRQYLVENPDTYIVKIYGLHKLKQTYGSKRYYFVVMENVFRYDLKGSTYNRKGKTDEWSKNVALKDQDFLDEERKLDMQQSSKLKIFNQIKRDVHFFSLNNIIEYSLLVGIHQVRGKYEQYDQIQKSQEFKGIFSRQRKQIYFLGFIDYFTQYSTMKMLESGIKQLVVKGASCLPPLDYQKRFIQFLYSYVFAK